MILKKIKILPISSGKAQGKVIYFNPKKNSQIYNGKIVIIHDLDASEIIPSLKKAAGVIGEVGGITAHGAVLLREFNIPSFLLPKAKEILKEGLEVKISDQGFLETSQKIKERIKLLEKELEPKLIKRGNWTLVKPKRSEDVWSTFTESFVQNGLLATPVVLLGLKKKNVKVKFDNKGFWIKNHPSPQEIVSKILNDRAWFLKHIQRQKKIFRQLKNYEKLAKKRLEKENFTLKGAFKEILQCQNWFTKTRPYIFLFSNAIDILEKDFYHLSLSFLPLPLATKLFDQIGRSAYAKKIKNLKIDKPRIPKTPKFPPSPLIFIEATPNYKRKIKLSREIKKILKNQPKNFKKKFRRYLEVLPIIVELNDEICYVCRFLLTALTPRFLKIIAYQAKKEKLFKTENEIFNLTIEEIGRLVKRLEKKNNDKRMKRKG